MSQYRASLIVSVYKDVAKLNCILQTLQYQTATDFEVIISEDGNSAEMRDFLAPWLTCLPNLVHLTQEDIGFRKNRALNRAIVAGRSDYFMFIDGDCVPHSNFIQAHLQQAEPKAVCAGRGVELGPEYSRRLIERPDFLPQLENRWHYLALARSLHRDHIKNYEFGFVSPLLYRLTRSRPIHIVGSNFSCSRQALEAVNGFNEDFESPGIGEDADVEWRLLSAGHHIKNIKFLAPVYHLHHPRSYTVTERNHQLMATTYAAGTFFCQHGLKDAAKRG